MCTRLLHVSTDTDRGRSNNTEEQHFLSRDPHGIASTVMNIIILENY